jgi:hypothetical protein
MKNATLQITSENDKKLWYDVMAHIFLIKSLYFYGKHSNNNNKFVTILFFMLYPLLCITYSITDANIIFVTYNLKFSECHTGHNF